MWPTVTLPVDPLVVRLFRRLGDLATTAALLLGIVQVDVEAERAHFLHFGGALARCSARSASFLVVIRRLKHERGGFMVVYRRAPGRASGPRVPAFPASGCGHEPRQQAPAARSDRG